jgi:hypothetical protein
MIMMIFKVKLRTWSMKESIFQFGQFQNGPINGTVNTQWVAPQTPFFQSQSENRTKDLNAV